MTATLRAKPRQTFSQLRSLQRLAGAVIMRPLARDWRTQRRWTDGRLTREVAAQFVKPNDRLTSLERIEIYNKQYWFRLIDCMIEDFTGLQTILGRTKFNALARAYLDEHPSRSFDLRNLGSHLVPFMEKHPSLVGPRRRLALDMAKFEWAQMIAFDGPVKRALTVDDLLGKPPNKIRLAIQPYITILSLGYPLDEYSIKLKKHALRGDASNAIEEVRGRSRAKRRPPLPRPKSVHVVVHRHNNALFYKRIEPEAHRLLAALQDGQTLDKAIKQSRIKDPEKLRALFETCAALGWFCAP
jgi:hypothetical protein